MTSQPKRFEAQRRYQVNLERFEDEVEPSMLAVMVSIVQNNGPWPLFIWGSTGTGKTSAGLLMIDRYRGRFAALSDYLGMTVRVSRGDEYKNGWRVGERQMWKDWETQGIWMIDDISCDGPATPYRREHFRKMLDRRAGFPTIYTSNGNIGQLSECWGDPVASRLNAGTVINLEASGDRRLRG